MKNKKSQSQIVSQIVTIILIILLVLAAIVIVWYVAIGEEPHFKITKEECWNEDSKNPFVEISLFCKYIALDSKDYKIDNYKKIMDSCKKSFYDLVETADYLRIIVEHNQYEFIVETKEICEQVGVEFITVYTCDLETEEFCKKHEERYSEDERDCRKVWCANSKTKQDLTTEWLNENCKTYWCDLEGNCDYFESVYDEGWGKYKCEFDENKYFVDIER